MTTNSGSNPPKTGDLTNDQIRFRFFKNLSDDQRLAVLKVFGAYPDDCTEPLNHVIERRLFDLILERRTAAQGEQSKAMAYCPACQSVGMSNCGNFDECGEPRCVTCHQKLRSQAGSTEQVSERDAMASLRSLEDRLDLIHQLCCGTAPKQSVGELIAVTQKMPEWASIRAALSTPAIKESLTTAPERKVMSDDDIDAVRAGLPLPQSTDSDYVTWSKEQTRTFARAFLNQQGEPTGIAK